MPLASAAQLARGIRGCAVGATRRDAHEALARAGYGFLELSFAATVDPTRDEDWFMRQREELRALRLPVEAMNGFLPADGYPVVGPDAAHDKVLGWAKTGFARAARLGVKVVTFGSGAARRVPEGFDPARASAQFSGLLAKLAPMARDHGLTFAVENLNRGETNLGNRLDDCLALVEASDCPAAMLTADLYHMLREDEGVDSLRKAAARIAHCHVAEKDGRAAPLPGGAAFAPYLAALAADCYHGRFTFECRWNGKTPDEAEARAALAAFRAQTA